MSHDVVMSQVGHKSKLVSKPGTHPGGVSCQETRCWVRLYTEQTGFFVGTWP